VEEKNRAEKAVAQKVKIQVIKAVQEIKEGAKVDFKETMEKKVMMGKVVHHRMRAQTKVVIQSQRQFAPKLLTRKKLRLLVVILACLLKKT